MIISIVNFRGPPALGMFYRTFKYSNITYILVKYSAVPCSLSNENMDKTWPDNGGSTAL